MVAIYFSQNLEEPNSAVGRLPVTHHIDTVLGPAPTDPASSSAWPWTHIPACLHQCTSEVWLTLHLHCDPSGDGTAHLLLTLSWFQLFLPFGTQDSFLPCPDDNPEVGNGEVGTLTVSMKLQEMGQSDFWRTLSIALLLEEDKLSLPCIS